VVSATLDPVDGIIAYLKDPGALPDPNPMFHALRELGPVFSPRPGLHVVTGFSAADELLRSPDFSRADAANDELRLMSAIDDPEDTLAGRTFLGQFSNRDRPDHTRLRRLAAPAFRPSVMAEYRRMAEEVVAEVLDAAFEKGAIDFRRDFAFLIPQRVFSRVMGVPAAHEDLLASWLTQIVNWNQTTRSSDEAWRSWSDAMAALTNYCADLINERRRGKEQNDLLGELIRAAERGEDIRDEDELVATVAVLFIGGLETTTNLLTNSMYLLQSHRDAWDAFVTDPDLAESVIEETLRFAPPTRVNSRKALVATSLAGVPIAGGDTMVVMMAAVNRDPARFEDPDRYDIGRAGPPHMTFGGGVHFCIGAPLARLEAPYTLRVLAENADVTQTAEVDWMPFIRRALASLPVTIRPRAANSARAKR
jgi:cytochrome P450